MEIKVITVPFILNVTINCYLIKTDAGYILIDSGRAPKREVIVGEIENAGCKPGDLKLIILTHGDFDHCGNAAYLRRKYGAEIAMHRDDSGMVEFGDMTWNRKKPNIVIRTLFGLFVKLDEPDRFKPDFYLKEGDDLAKYGLEATILEIPGHSRGSIGILTSGDLFCGDLLANTKKPAVWSIIDDKTTAKTSVEKLKRLEINIVYPGHGRPFPMGSFIEIHP